MRTKTSAFLSLAWRTPSNCAWVSAPAASAALSAWKNSRKRKRPTSWLSRKFTGNAEGAMPTPPLVGVAPQFVARCPQRPLICEVLPASRKTSAMTP